MPQSLDDFKLKINGQKLRVRVMKEGEKIKPTSLYVYLGYTGGTKEWLLSQPEAYIIDRLRSEHVDFHPSKSVGEKISGVHEERLYIEVLSSFYSPISTDEYTEKEYC